MSLEKTITIKNWPIADRPREKLLKLGESSLSDSELLAILLRTGVRGRSAVDIARDLLSKYGSFQEMSSLDSSQWKKWKGLGDAKIAQIRAAIEIGRRFHSEKFQSENPYIRSAQDAVNIVLPQMRGFKKEAMKILLLNAQNRLIEIVQVAQGTVNHVNPILREMFHQAIQSHAAALICIHNHPSGKIDPSQEDRLFTKKLCEGGNVLQIKVLDHIILGNEQYYSFQEQGAL